MRVKIGETPVIRGSPSATRTLEVFVDEDWLVGAQLEKCVSFQESADHGGRLVVVFSRSISSQEARAFSQLLAAAADSLETTLAEGKET
jgi:hypothetical protein